VLVPMLISKRDAVRRTSDVALATRVLNGTSSGRLLKRAGPASGHRSDPDWRASEDELDENFDEDEYDDDEYEHEEEEEEEPQKTVVLAAPVTADTEPEYLDVEAADEPTGAIAVGESATEDEEVAEANELTLNFEEPQAQEENVDTAIYEIATDEYEDDDADGADDEYEYVDDSSGIEAPEESDLRVADSMVAARRRRYDPAKAAVISARKYKFRKRMLTVLALLTVASAAAPFAVPSVDWWVCGPVGAVTVLYLGYLRRQTRIEERLRRRRAQRIARARLGVENTDDHEFDVVPSRLRRPGSVVLEIDDEDPIFEHLDYAPFARDFDLPHAAGQ